MSGKDLLPPKTNGVVVRGMQVTKWLTQDQYILAKGLEWVKFDLITYRIEVKQCGSLEKK